MSSNRRYKYDDYDLDNTDRYKKERRRSRSRSRSRNRQQQQLQRPQQQRRVSRSRSRSRTRSRSGSRAAESRRRRHHKRSSYSRSRSRSRGYSSRRDRRNSSRRRRSRSGSRSTAQHGRRHTRSRTQSPAKRCLDGSRISEEPSATRNHHTERATQSSISLKTTRDDGNSNTSFASNSQDTNLDDLPLPQPHREPKGAYYDLNTDEPIDKERIHREIEEKLRQALAKEGKVYPPPKQEASHPVFANDGSFLEIFKKMQQQQQPATAIVNNSVMPQLAPVVPAIAAATPITAPYVAATALGKSAPPPPIVGRRRGGKILKTGVVAKPKPQTENNADPKDFWSLYLAEVNKYKNTACESDGGTRPLVK